MLKNFIAPFKQNPKKLKDFGVNCITGLFTGVTIGIFFNLTTSTTFNRWINPMSIEIVPTIIYVISIIGVLIFFYNFGTFLTKLIDKSGAMNFHLNFISGTYSSTLSFLLVLYFNAPKIRNTLAIIGIPTFIVLARFAIKKKR